MTEHSGDVQGRERGASPAQTGGRPPVVALAGCGLGGLGVVLGCELVGHALLHDALVAERDAHLRWLRATVDVLTASRDDLTAEDAARQVAVAARKGVLDGTSGAHLFAPESALGRRALSSPSDVVFSGLHDAEGRPVITAYTFDPTLRLGVAVERLHGAAFAPVRWLECGALGAFLVLAWLSTRGRRSPLPTHEPVPAPAPSTTYGQYTLGRKLGEGGMGVVYEASHRLLRRPTALKLLRNDAELDPQMRLEALRRFEREVQLTSQLNHPNTIVIYDYGQTDEGTFFYAMEYVEGVDLERLVRLDGPLPAARVIHLALQLCGSLAEAHARGLIHRDIKPANVLVCERGGVADFVKVLDFGLVKSLHGPALSAQHVLLGTPLYMAPELVRDPQSASPRSDLYSVGALLHWLATGMTIHDAALVSASVRPLLGPSDGSTLRAPGDPFHGVPADLERVIMRCLDSDPGERPESAPALIDELRRCRDAGRWTDAMAHTYWAQRGPQLERLLDRPQTAHARTIAGS